MHPGITFQENLVLLIAIYQEVIISMAVHIAVYTQAYTGMQLYMTTHTTHFQKSEQCISSEHAHHCILLNTCSIGFN